MSTHNLSLLATAVMTAALLGCGGGGDSSDSGSAGEPSLPSASSDAEAVYGGTLTGSTSSHFNMLILENGDIWSMYGTQTPSMFVVDGFVQGASTASNGTLSSSNLRDFGSIPSAAGTASASYNKVAKTISGTLNASGQTVSFTGGPIPGTLYNYDTPALVSTVAGAWSLQSLTGETIGLTIADSGTFSASTSLGCSFSGSLAPRASGKNVFNAALTFGPSPCPLPGASASGIALAYALASGQTQLIFAGTDASRSIGTAAFGTR